MCVGGRGALFPLFHRNFSDEEPDQMIKLLQLLYEVYVLEVGED